MRVRYLAVFLCSIFFSSLPFGTIFAEEKPVYTIGIVPQQAVTKLVRLWTPLLEKISEQSGYKLRFKTAVDINSFEDNLFTGEYDFAYMNPYHYTVFSKDKVYSAFARERNKSILGLVVVHKDSPIKNVDMLNNESLAFPSEAAFAASILPRAELKTKGIDIDAHYVGSHDSVYHVVARKMYPAGGGILRTYLSVSPEIRSQLKVLWQSEKHTPHAFAAHKRIDPAVVKSIQQVMINMDKDPGTKELIDNLRMNGFIKASDSDWQGIRDLNIDTLK